MWPDQGLARELRHFRQVRKLEAICVMEPARARVAASEIRILIESLARRGFEVMGPTARDGAIVYDNIEFVEELPRGWVDEQDAGRYRLRHEGGDALFGYTVGPQSWKQYLHPPLVKVFDAERSEGVFRILNNGHERSRPYALLGVRPCELSAIAVQDKALLDGPFADSVYRNARENAFIVAVQCTRSASTCFCASMGTGPKIKDTKSADVTLTEMVAAEEHWFLVEAGTGRGREVLGDLEHRKATREESQAAEAALEAAAGAQTRSIATTGIRELLSQNFEHPRWDQVAERCLTCGNCTMVCPTCFCTNYEDSSDLSGDRAQRWRRWDSCFTMQFSYIHGGSVRTSGKSRYRQWLTHKLASWIDQFGSSGCVGCGRCITWCPVGIDITQEVEAIRGAASYGATNA